MKNNQEKQEKNLIWWIIGGIIILGMGGFVIYKVVQGNKDNKPSLTSPPVTDLPTPSKEEELERYLLEKRLDLKKYFVFNLGKEVKTSQQAETGGENFRSISTNLTNDLTKLTTLYEKKAEAKGYGLILGKIEELGGITGWRTPKNYIAFLGKQVDKGDSDWSGNKLDEKIKNGQDCYVVFEKDDEFEEVYFARGAVDEKGKRWLAFTNNIFLRMKAITTHIFQNKKEALEFLKNNDPALANFSN